MVALFPPNSKIVLPNLLCTISDTLYPISVDPVKEINSNLLSLIILSPIDPPPP